MKSLQVLADVFKESSRSALTPPSTEPAEPSIFSYTLKFLGHFTGGSHDRVPDR
jgi:hypothetical protein